MSAAVKPMQEAAIRQYAKPLRLPTLGGQLARLAEQAVKEKQSWSRFSAVMDSYLPALQAATKSGATPQPQSKLLCRITGG